MVHIRTAQQKDATDIAKVQVDSYQTYYRGLLPDDFLDGFTYEEQTAHWQTILTPPNPTPVIVATDDDDRAIGYAHGQLLEGDEPFDCEVMALHVIRGYQRQGIGTRLIGAMAQHFHEHNDSHSFMLWTIHNNPTRALYEKLGGKYMGSRQNFLDVEEIAFGWHHIQDLFVDESDE